MAGGKKKGGRGGGGQEQGGQGNQGGRGGGGGGGQQRGGGQQDQGGRGGGGQQRGGGQHHDRGGGPHQDRGGGNQGRGRGQHGDQEGRGGGRGYQQGGGAGRGRGYGDQESRGGGRGAYQQGRGRGQPGSPPFQQQMSSVVDNFPSLSMTSGAPAQVPVPRPAQAVQTPVQQPAQRPAQAVQTPVQQPAQRPAQAVQPPAQPPVQQPAQAAQPPVPRPAQAVQTPVQQPAQRPAQAAQPPAQPPVQQPAQAAQPPVQQPAQPAAPKPGQPPVTIQLAHRKTFGTQGRRTMVETNHMALTIRPPKAAVIHYDVALDPDKPKRLLRPAMNEFIRLHCKGRNPAFDGRKNLYSYGPLPIEERREYTLTVNNPERNNVEEFKITLKTANTLDLSALNKYLASKDRVSVPQDVLQAVDVVMRQAAVKCMTQVGRSFFSQPEGRVVDLGNGLELWVGVFQSAILGWKPFLNVDVAHKGFPKAQKVVDLIYELYSTYREGPDLSKEMRDTRELDQFIRGLKVDYQITNNPSSKRTYRVNGVKECAARLTFNTQDDGKGKEISVADYFAREKNLPLKYPNLPCLHVGSINRNIYVPVELCKLIAGQVVIKKMDETQTSNMIKEAATPADVRKRKIMDAFNKLGLNADPCMNEFGISVSGEMEKVEARVLNAPMLEYRENRKQSVERGVWRADRQKFLTGGRLDKWAILVLDNKADDRSVDNFVRLLQQNGQGCGMEVGQYVGTRKANPFQKPNIIRELQSLLGCSIVFVVVPDRGDTYANVKQIAELQFGILTQCLKTTTLNRKMNPATAYNILLKVNAKLNGVNHALHGESRPPCLGRPVMLMGADVTHPSPDAKNTPSIAAVTASHDPRAFKYNIEWRLQPPREEIILDLENIVETQLRYFYKSTGQQPQRIIFYRDGVSDGQFATVLSRELQAIRRACARLNQTYRPAITFLVVQKRHHTRFFPIDRRDEDGKNRNVPPGLVVDRTITHPRDMDFYLVSHQSIQGTSRPTKYCVLHDDADMSEDEVEQLTYYLCHLFSRCNRSVSYPAPTYYAHLAAFRAKAYLEGQNVNINNLPREQAQRVIKNEFKINSPMFFV